MTQQVKGNRIGRFLIKGVVRRKFQRGEGRFSSLAKRRNLCKSLEAEVGIDPENSISDRKIAEFACQSTTIPHYPGTILLLSFHPTLLAILLAIKDNCRHAAF